MADDQVDKTARYLNVEEAAKYLGMSRGTLLKLVERDELPPPKRFGGRVVRFDKEALDKYMSWGVRDERDNTDNEQEDT